MIRALGLQKIVIILAMVSAVALLYFYGFMVLGPQKLKAERSLRTQKSEISQVTQNMEDLRAGIEKFEVQKDKFQNLQTLGFFDPQDRLVLRERLNDIQSKSGLLAAQYTINSAVTEVNDKAKEAGYKIFNTPITFSLSALDDAEIYKFIYLLNYGFPGQVSINSMTIEKIAEVTPTLLQKIGVGQPAPILNANLNINLRTLVEDPEAQRERQQRDGDQAP